MIKELQRIVEIIDENGTQISKLPSNQEMFNKINELVRVVNRLEKFRENTEPNPFISK